MEINILEPPFSILFSWNGRYRRITLKNGEDVLRLASKYTQILNRSEIEYIEETNLNKDTKTSEVELEVPEWLASEKGLI